MTSHEKTAKKIIKRLYDRGVIDAVSVFDHTVIRTTIKHAELRIVKYSPEIQYVQICGNVTKEPSIKEVVELICGHKTSHSNVFMSQLCESMHGKPDVVGSSSYK